MYAGSGVAAIQAALSGAVKFSVQAGTVYGVTFDGIENLSIKASNSGFNDLLIGLAGADVLDGGAGADTLLGGAGDDTYIVDNTGDKITENASEGVDTVLASVSYSLPANVENLTLTGTAAVNATGNSGDNTLLGNAADNTLSGGAGNDHYRFGGGYGQDTIHDVDLTVGNIDTVVMDAGIAPGAVAVSQAAGQIVLSLNAHDQLRVDWDTANGIGVERVEFANGTVWDAATLAGLANNHAPTVAHPLANQAATEDSAFSLTAPADTFADVDSGDSLSYSATQADNSALPAWLAFNPATRGFSGTPLNGDVGVLSLKLTATDPWGASAATSFTVPWPTPTTRPPSPTPSPTRPWPKKPRSISPCRPTPSPMSMPATC